MKVGVERDDRLTLAPRVIEDVDVGRLREAHFARVVRDKPALSQLLGGAARQPLVEQELQALFDSSITLSSRAVAAYARTCEMSSGSSSGYSRSSSARSGYVAKASSTRRTVSRSPRTHGCPFIRAGSEVMRSKGPIGQGYAMADEPPGARRQKQPAPYG